MRETVLFLTTRVVNAGSVHMTIPRLLGLMHIPAVILKLFPAAGSVDSRFGPLTSSMHRVAIALT